MKVLLADVSGFPGLAGSHLRLIWTLLIVNVGLAGAAGMGRLQGRVMNSETGQPISRAVLEVDGTDLGTTTDDSGYYCFSALPAETLEITAEAPTPRRGFRMSPHQERVVVVANTATTLDFAFVPSREMYKVEGMATPAKRRTELSKLDSSLETAPDDSGPPWTIQGDWPEELADWAMLSIVPPHCRRECIVLHSREGLKVLELEGDSWRHVVWYQWSELRRRFDFSRF